MRTNVRVEWVLSPHMPQDIHKDGNDMDGFLVTTRRIKKGEELLWYYDVSQSHRSGEPEPVCSTSAIVPTVSTLAIAQLSNDNFECQCSTTCVGTCINAPLPQNAIRTRKQRKIED
jgi:hypothetical protein